MVFNPNLESAPAPEQPVYSNISTGSSGGMATVAGNALEMLGGFFVQASERRQTQRAAQVRQSFLDNLESVRGLVDEGNFNQASITAGQAVSAYLAAGGSFDTETRAAATAISGLPEDMFGVSQQALDFQAEQTRKAALIQDDTFNAYLQLEATANPNASEQELFSLAEARYNQANADAQLLIEAQNTGQLNFEAEGRAAINRTLDNFTQGSLGALADAIFNGVPTDPRQLAQVRTQWNVLQSTLNGTLGNVSDDQRAEVTARFDNITSIIDNLDGVLSTEGQAERLNSFVMQLMSSRDLTDYTTSEILGAVLASNDLTSFIMGGQEPAMFFNSPTGRQLIGDVMNRLEISFNDTVRREAYAALPTQADGTVNRNGVITFSDLPDSVRQDVEGITDDRLVSSIRVDGMLLGDVTGQDVTSAQQADRLTASTYRLGAFMLSTQGRPLSPALIRQLGLTEGLNDRLSTIEALGLDDEGEASARITLRSGISTQISSQQNYVRRLEETAAETGLRWNAETGEYEITNQDFIRSFAESVGMNPNMLMENGVVRLRADTTRDEGWRSQLRQRIGRLDEAFAGREALGLLQSAFDSLRVEMPEDQAVAADTISALQDTPTGAGTEPIMFIDRLAMSESSGNPQAEITIGDGRRFVGLLQFGEARLQDYKNATGEQFTQDEFQNDPELQRRVNEWHIGDIDRAIDSLGGAAAGYSRDGLRAVAHLGGITGMRRFVESGGEYNPSDELGTSLQAYYDRFSGRDSIRTESLASAGQ